MDYERHETVLSAFAKLDRLLDRFVDLRTARTDFTNEVAFQWDGGTNNLQAVARPVRIDPVELLGIDRQKQCVLDNTKRFLAGQRANNVLL